MQHARNGGGGEALVVGEGADEGTGVVLERERDVGTQTQVIVEETTPRWAQPVELDLEAALLVGTFEPWTLRAYSERDVERVV